MLQSETNIPEKVTFYGSRFASIAFPAKTPKERIWERENGRDSLVIIAGEIKDEKTGKYKDLKVPSGIIPRRILVYLSHQWMENHQNGVRNRQIELGSSLHEFLEKIDIKKGGSTYKSIIDQTNRLFLAKIAYHSTSDHHYSVKQTLVAREYQLWWSKIEEQSSFFPSYVEITEDFAYFLDKSMPLNLETIQNIGANCLAFDLYTWLNLRHYSIVNPVTIDWESLHEQLGANYKNLRQFKPEVKKAWELVQKTYQHNSKLTEKGIILIRSSPDIQIKNYSKSKSLEFLKSQNLLKSS